METPPGIDKNTTTHGSYWGGSVLPYWMFLVATVFPLTGFFGFDHLLFRSPSTAVAKLSTNILTFGLWYFYDIVQAITDRDFVEEYGLSKPVVGPAGLAFQYFRGVSKGSGELPPADGQGFFSVFLFLAYFFTILTPFGISNFIAGDTQGGIGKFFLSFGIWGFLWVPFLFVAALYELYLLLMKPDEVFQQGTWRPPPLNYFIGPTGFAKNIMRPQAVEEAAKAAANAPGFFSSFFTMIWNFIKWILSLFGLIDPGAIITAAKCACAAGDIATRSGVALPAGVDIMHAAGCPMARPLDQAYQWTQGEGKRIVEMGTEASKKGAELVGQVAEFQNEVQDKMTAFTDPQKLKELAIAQAQKGGATTESPYDWIFVGGILLLIGCGLGISFIRKMTAQKKNESTPDARKDYDTPPSPGDI